MFSTKINQYLFIFGIVAISSYIANKYKTNFETNDEYELIKKYLLNDSPLYGFNRPKLWIHSKYEINSRKWKDFYSRNSTDLNQPYLNLTIKSIINHCGNDFNICLIDDESFSKLIPSWDIDLVNVSEPMKSHYRELGMTKILYYYGGMIVPNSFVCLKNLKELYSRGLESSNPFVCENINHSLDLIKQKTKMLFTPSTFFMGANKNDATIKMLIEYLKIRNSNPHFSSENDFIGDTSNKLLEFIGNQKMNLILGQQIGVKTNNRKVVLVEDLMEENYIDYPSDLYGIYIPGEVILNRTKYQWFAVMSEEDILSSNMVISKYLQSSIIDNKNIYNKATEKPSVVSI
jgi:hypothetical protein